MSSLLHEPRQLVEHRDHLVVVAVADHAGLRRPGRPRGVDVGEEVVLADLGHGTVESVGVRRLRSARPRASSSGRSANASTCCSRGRSARALVDLRALLGVLDEHSDRLRVVDHVRAVVRRAVRVDRRPDRADEAEGEVEQAPLEARRGEDREGVALPDPEREQPVGDVVDPSRRVGAGDGRPGTVSLGEVGGPVGARRVRVSPERADRARPRPRRLRELHHPRRAYGEGKGPYT